MNDADYESDRMPMTGDEFLAWLAASITDASVIEGEGKRHWLGSYRSVHGNELGLSL